MLLFRNYFPESCDPDPAHTNTHQGVDTGITPKTTGSVSGIKLSIEPYACELLTTADTCTKMIIMQLNTQYNLALV